MSPGLAKVPLPMFLEASWGAPVGRPGPGASFLPCSQVRRFEYELTERILFAGIWASSGAVSMISKVHTWQRECRVRGNAGVPRPEVRSTQKRLFFFPQEFCGTFAKRAKKDKQQGL